MTRTVYVNGEYLPETEAKVSIFDRGFLMADGVYEVTSVLDGKLIEFDGHAARLQRSLDELDMANPISKEDLLEVHLAVVTHLFSHLLFHCFQYHLSLESVMPMGIPIPGGRWMA